MSQESKMLHSFIASNERQDPDTVMSPQTAIFISVRQSQAQILAQKQNFYRNFASK